MTFIEHPRHKLPLPYPCHEPPFTLPILTNELLPKSGTDCLGCRQKAGMCSKSSQEVGVLDNGKEAMVGVKLIRRGGSKKGADSNNDTDNENSIDSDMKGLWVNFLQTTALSRHCTGRLFTKWRSWKLHAIVLGAMQYQAGKKTEFPSHKTGCNKPQVG